MGSRQFHVLINLAFLLILVHEIKTQANSTDDGVVFCYYDSASNTRPDYARFGIDDIPLDVCTHLIYSFIVPTADGNITFSEPQGIVEGKSNSFEDFIGLKNSTDAANVKFMASLGGLKAGSENFTLVVNNQTLRNRIIDNIYAFVRTNDLDGIDLLWQYPTLNGGTPTDKVKYPAFMQNLKAAFGGKYLLTAAVGPSQLQINESYYVQQLNQHLDYISVMTYNYHDSSGNVTGVNAPLYGQDTDSVEDSAKNVNASITTWIANGAAPSKLVLGLGAFGKTFTLASLNNTGTGAPVTAARVSGLTGVEGELSYLEICNDQTADPDSWNITQVDADYVYANKDLFWVGYDNIETIFAKGSYAKSMGLAGVSLWSLDLADFTENCGEKYLLIKSAGAGFKEALVNNSTITPNANDIISSNAAQNRTYITIITDDLIDDYETEEEDIQNEVNKDKNAVEEEESSSIPKDSDRNDRPLAGHDEQSSKIAAQSTNILEKLSHNSKLVNHLQLINLQNRLTNQQKLRNQQKYINLQTMLQNRPAVIKLRKVAKSTSRDKRNEYRNPFNLSTGTRQKLVTLNFGK